MASCKSSTLIYGRTGEGKTALLGAAAQWVWQATGLPMRLYSAEDGRLGTIQHLIDKGRIQVLDIKGLPNPSEVLDQISKGWWLAPHSGDKKELIPPNAETWKQVGAIAYEGMTEFADMILDELTEKGAANQIMGAEKAPAQYTSGKMRIANANPTYYGIAQKRVHRAVNESQLLPVYVFWTARELKVMDTDTKCPIYGPLIAGRAATLDCPAWFGNCVHMDRVPVVAPNKATVLERRAYLQNHLDPDTNVPYLAQVRVPIEMAKEVPEFIKVQDDAFAMQSIFTKLEELRKRAQEFV